MEDRTTRMHEMSGAGVGGWSKSGMSRSCVTVGGVKKELRESKWCPRRDETYTGQNTTQRSAT